MTAKEEIALVVAVIRRARARLAAPSETSLRPIIDQALGWLYVGEVLLEELAASADEFGL